MRCETEVRAFLSTGEQELCLLNVEIASLSRRVAGGEEGWRDALASLAARMERRRTLRSRLDSPSWVLAG